VRDITDACLQQNGGCFGACGEGISGTCSSSARYLLERDYKRKGQGEDGENVCDNRILYHNFYVSGNTKKPEKQRFSGFYEDYFVL
jgi:hypothetical protein